MENKRIVAGKEAAQISKLSEAIEILKLKIEIAKAQARTKKIKLANIKAENNKDSGDDTSMSAEWQYKLKLTQIEQENEKIERELQEISLKKLETEKEYYKIKAEGGNLKLFLEKQIQQSQAEQKRIKELYEEKKTQIELEFKLKAELMKLEFAQKNKNLKKQEVLKFKLPVVNNEVYLSPPEPEHKEMKTSLQFLPQQTQSQSSLIKLERETQENLRERVMINQETRGEVPRKSEVIELKNFQMEKEKERINELEKKKKEIQQKIKILEERMREKKFKKGDSQNHAPQVDNENNSPQNYLEGENLPQKVTLKEVSTKAPTAELKLKDQTKTDDLAKDSKIDWIYQDKEKRYKLASCPKIQ